VAGPTAPAASAPAVSTPRPAAAATTGLAFTGPGTPRSSNLHMPETDVD
jgi:hypothetical protein